MRVVLIAIFLLGCSRPIQVVDKIEYSVVFTQYCLKGKMSSNAPFLSCTPSKKLCEWGYEKAMRYGSLVGLRAITKCTAAQVQIK